MNAIARTYQDDAQIGTTKADQEYLEALTRLRNHKSAIAPESVKKIKAMDLPEISGNLSKKKFIFF